MIPERVSIDKRFLGADNRTRYGHWEKDAIVSRKGDKGSWLWLKKGKAA